MMQRKVSVWGQWDDSAPYFVRAACSLDKARDYLQFVISEKFGDKDSVVFPIRRNAVVALVNDCEFEGPMPCPDLACRHRHAETVYEFMLVDREEYRDFYRFFESNPEILSEK